MIRLPCRLVEDLARANTVEQILSIAASSLPRLVAADRAEITILDRDAPIVRTSRRDGRPEPVDAAATVLPGSPLARVRESGVALQMGADEIARDPDPLMQALYDQGLRRMLFVPMQTSGRTVGVLALARRAPKPFTWRQLETLSAAANWIAAQAALFGELRAHARRAEIDPLTKLANRTRLMRVLNGPGELHLPDAKGRVIGVLHLDLDGFRAVNDQMGPEVGDRILCRTAEILRQTAAPADLVARIGADAFAIVTRTDTSGGDLAMLAERLLERLGPPIEMDARTLRCPARIGTAVARGGDTDATRLLANAEIALGETQRSAAGAVCAFTEDMRREVEKHRALCADLHEALAARAFVPLFEPVIDLNSGAVVELDVSGRWAQPDSGDLNAGHVRLAAAEAGLDTRIAAVVRDQAFTEVKALRAAGTALPRITLTADAPLLCDPDTPDVLLWEITGKGLSPTDLGLAVAEPLLIGNPGAVVQTNIARLCDLGFGVLIAGFGGSPAAIADFRQLKIKGLRMRRSLTRCMGDPYAGAILRSVAEMARSRGMQLTAKGVESDAEIAHLRAIGCASAMGAAIAPPMEAAVLSDYLARRSPMSREKAV